MDFMQQTYFGNTLAMWLTALGASCATYVALRVCQRIVLHRLGKWAERTQTEVDDLVIAVLKKTKPFTLVMLALFAGVHALALAPWWAQAGRMGVILATLLQGAIWMNAAVSSIIARTARQRAEGDASGATTLNALGFTFKLAIWSVFLLMALDNLGVNVTGLLTGLGIGGIAVALAMQNILGDLLASLSIVLDKPFELGDFIITGEHLGTVEHIGLKTTRLRSLSGEQIIFSNNDLLGSRVRNFKRMVERRVVIALGVTFQTPHGKLSALPLMLREIVERQEGVRFDRAHFKEIGDSALVFEVVYYLLDPDYNRHMDVQQAVNLDILRRFESEGISFAHPTRTVLLAGSGIPGAIERG